MKLLEEAFTKGGGGHVRLVPDTPEDMWHVYNLMANGDVVRATTFRKVVRESNTGSTRSEKKRVALSVLVEDIDFDPQQVSSPACAPFLGRR